MVFEYSYPPNATIPSRGATSNPASTASARVTVNKATGSKFKFNGSAGEVVFDFPAELKLVEASIDPRGMPNAVTEDWIFVISRAAENGLAKSTVTSVMLFAIPVVDNTRG